MECEEGIVRHYFSTSNYQEMESIIEAEINSKIKTYKTM